MTALKSTKAPGQLWIGTGGQYWIGANSPENLIPAPDCGMKYMPRDVAYGKLQALAQGAKIVREELG